MCFQFFIAPLTASSLYFEKIIKSEKNEEKSSITPYLDFTSITRLFIAPSASVNSKLKQIWHKNLKKIIIQPISPLGDVAFKVNRHATRLLNHTLFARKFLVRKKDEVT